MSDTFSCMKEENKTPQEIAVSITSLASGGSFVGTITAPETHAGKKAFIPYTAPGENVTATITLNKKSFVNGMLVSVANPSSERVTPPCPAFGQCGGCDLQHINLPQQRSLKSQMVADLLRVHGGIEVPGDVQVLGDDLPGLNYRRRMSFHINKKGEFGLYRKHARSIVEIDHCPISTPAINECLQSNLALFRECAPECETVTIEDHDEGIFIALEVHPRNDKALTTLVPKPAFQELIKRIPNVQVNYRHKPIFKAEGRATDAPPVGHFSQNNRLANDLMIDYIKEHVTTERVTDLYAGAGNISIPLAEAGHIVTAVELDPHLVAFGQSRAEERGLQEILTFHHKGCEKWIDGGTPDATVVLDPPRSGALEVCQRLSPSVSNKLVYVSCYPPTFARDVQVLVERGYKLESVKMLDMFPQTYHAELIGVLVA
jgi:23S rRNA (uracil1939-C5)-methyltransferase